MKFTPVLILAYLITLPAFHSAYAACASEAPVAAAKSFYSKHADFSLEDPSKIRTLITPRLFAALSREYKCAQGQICALETDPWTDAQDGNIGKPVEFETASNTGVEATVSMTYPFILDKTHHQQHVTLFFERKSPADCWLLADLVGPRGGSLLQAIEKWQKEFGNGL